MNKQTAGIDMDSTLTKCLELWLFLLNKDHGTNFQMADIQGWDFDGPIRERFTMKTLLDYLQVPGFFRHQSPIAGAIEGVRSLQARYDVTIITAEASEICKVEKREWIAEYLPGLEDSIIFSHKKHEHKFDLFIDDREKTLIEYRRAHPTALVTGLRYPHNQGVGGLCSDWGEIVNVVLHGDENLHNPLRGVPLFNGPRE